MEVVKKEVLKKVFPERKKSTHKYDYGHLLVIGGSDLYSGSPALVGTAALASLRTGVDLITIAAPRRAATIIASFAPDLITYPLEGNFLDKKHLKTLLKLTEGKMAVVIGNGLERRKETLSTINEFLKKIKLPCVIDADAIHAVSKNKKVIRENFIITPHQQEFYILTNIKIINKPLKEKIKIVKESASKLKTTILLKGNPDIISNGKQIAINKTGNVYLTKGGTGDTLAGICGSLLAQNNKPFESACAAAYINGKAGDIVAKNYKQSLIASDIIKAIPKAIK